ncbi:MAG: hypothetical protein KC656_15795, partial [Myxococcales bacterium]|nr:hypothetical protein [Myxococcales bacterium]
APGRIEVDVDRWGDAQPLFRVEACDDAGCRWAAVTRGAKLERISVPDAWKVAPELLDDDPDCDAAKSLVFAKKPTETGFREIAVPPYEGEPAGPASCGVVGVSTDPAGKVVVCSLGERRAVFVVDGSTWVSLPCASDPMLELTPGLQYQGLQVKERGDLTL